MQFKRPLAMWAGVLLLCVAAAGSPGQTQTVTNCSESALRSAMAGGGTVTFACNGMIPLSNTVVIGKNTRLDASGRQVTISGRNAVRVFYVNTNVTLTLINLTIANGLNTNGFGGGIYNEGTLNATNCHFVTNTVQGAPDVHEGPPVQDGCGGAVYTSGALNLFACTFVSNSACGGYGGYEGNVNGGGDGGGGAVYNTGALNAIDCSFASNCACGGQGTFAYTGTSWSGGPGGVGRGGAVYNSGALNITDCSFAWNSACGGTGVINGGSSPGIAGGAAEGGGICNLGVMAIKRSLFASNTCVGGAGGNGIDGGFVNEGFPIGGGIGAAGGDARGGAFFVVGASSLINCTLTDNQATGGSGGTGGKGGYWFNLGTGQLFGGPGGAGGAGGAARGALYDAAGALRLTNCTIAFNTSVGGPGGLGGSGSPAGSTGGSGASAGALQTTNGITVNCLLDSNSPTNGTGGIVDAGHNLSSDASCTFTNVGSLNNTDAGLGLLADNGGPTLTLALLPGSPAIDAGDTALAPATDQRGFPRPAGLASDIGAFEYGSVMPAIAVSRAGASGLKILASGNVGRSCRLLSSTDLSSWVPMATNCIGSDGTVLFYDDGAPGGACRFYLLIMP